jgi:predicted nucleic acid-binding protein
MVVHAAVLSGTETLYSEDLNADQLIEGIRIVNPVSAPGVRET